MATKNTGVKLDIKINKKLAQIARNAAKLNFKNEYDKFLFQVATSVERESKLSATELDAVDTGRMRSSIRIKEFRSGYAVIGPNVRYAFYVHEGLGSNARRGRRPFMEIGLQQSSTSIDKLNKDFGAKIKGKLVN